MQNYHEKMNVASIRNLIPAAFYVSLDMRFTGHVAALQRFKVCEVCDYAMPLCHGRGIVSNCLFQCILRMLAVLSCWPRHSGTGLKTRKSSLKIA